MRWKNEGPDKIESDKMGDKMEKIRLKMAIP
jgi:hypothetical protein